MPPETREQWAEWCRIWPVAWKVPEQGPGGAAAAMAASAPVAMAEQRYFEHCMAMALDLAAMEGRGPDPAAP